MVNQFATVGGRQSLFYFAEKPLVVIDELLDCLLHECLQPVTHREILGRMLNNLRQIYLTQQDGRKGLAVLDMLLAIPPGSADLLRERALLRLNLDQYLGAA